MSEPLENTSTSTSLPYPTSPPHNNSNTNTVPPTRVENHPSTNDSLPSSPLLPQKIPASRSSFEQQRPPSEARTQMPTTHWRQQAPHPVSSHERQPVTHSNYNAPERNQQVRRSRPQSQFSPPNPSPLRQQHTATSMVEALPRMSFGS